MRDYHVPPPAHTPTPPSLYRSESVNSSVGHVRHVTPEDAFCDEGFSKSNRMPRPQSYHELKSSMRQNERDTSQYTLAPPSRQISNTSNHTTVSGSENWQTIEDDSEPEQDATEAYYAKLRAARNKRFTPEEYIQGGQPKKQKGVPPYESRAGATDARIVSGSDANWTDEDAF